MSEPTIKELMDAIADLSHKYHQLYSKCREFEKQFLIPLTERVEKLERKLDLLTEDIADLFLTSGDVE